MNFRDRYQYNPVIDFLGKGGFARVYKSKDSLFNRTVAPNFFL
jgi:serine/threonine protein kinase